MQLLFKLAYPRSLKSTLSATEYRNHKRDFLRRGLFCTSYGGNYNKLAGWVVCVVGSPPKGTVMMEIEGVGLNPQVSTAHYVYGRSLRLSSNPKYLAILEAFFAEHLEGKNEPLTLDTKPMYT